MVTPLQYSCLENPMARGAWVGYYSVGFPGGSDSKESACNAGNPGSIPDQEAPLEKGMAPHSSNPAWRSPWTEEPGGLQSMGWQRVGHD